MSDDHEFVVCNLIYLKATNASDLDFAMKLKTYFCILRHTMQLTMASFEANGSLYSCTIATHSMLASYLSGLGKLSQLIGLDCIWFLMIFLTAPKHFGCWVVTFKVRMRNLDAFNIDLQDYVVQRYNHVPAFMPERDSQGDSICDCKGSIYVGVGDWIEVSVCDCVDSVGDCVDDGGKTSVEIESGEISQETDCDEGERTKKSVSTEDDTGKKLVTGS
ncbi:hypothetical protein V6N11_008579 [Hibiscus sabdariffa]|uniref:Uncharacterized protein n=1 Tax=Hibiscus sabdariffa TaxID=183260 RepID=A0ABR2PP17_9ROSI